MNLRAVVVDAATTRELRRALLRPTWAKGSRLPGDDDPAAVHVAVYDEDELAGCCVLQPRPYPFRPQEPRSWQLRGMAVAAERQRQGVGAAVLEAATAELRSRGARLVWCDARSTAVGFYRRHGFTEEGPEFEHAETGLPHRRMWREIEP